MIRPVAVACLASMLVAALALAGCSSPSHRAETRVVLTTIGPTTGTSSDVPIGGEPASSESPSAAPGGAAGPGESPGDDATSGAIDTAGAPRLRTLDVTSTPAALDLASRNGSLAILVDPAAAGLTITADLRCGGSSRTEARTRAAAATVDVTETPSGTLVIRPVMPGGWGNGDAAAFHIVLPAPASVLARSSNGRVRVEGARGPIDVDTSNGNLTFIAIDGDILAATSNGRITLKDTAGNAEVRSSNGRVTVDNHLGALAIRTSNGAMNITLNEASDAPVVARTSNGSVELSVGPAFGGWLEAETSNGRVSLDGEPRTDGPLEIERRSMSVKLAGDDDRSRIESSNGSVRVFVRQ